MKQRILSLALAMALALSLCLFPAAAAPAVEVTVNGEPVRWTDARPFIDENSRTLVPLRAVADAMGLSVGWDEEAREASFTDGSRAIYFPIGSTEARAGVGGVIPMDTAAVIVGDRTYAPVRYLAQYFGFSVDWDDETKTVLITGSLKPVWDPWGDCSFADKGIDIDVDDHGRQSYRTVTESGAPITCEAVVTGYEVFDADDPTPDSPGYEWRVMTIDVTVPSTSEDRRQMLFSTNYYNIKLDEDTLETDAIDEHHTVVWQGRRDEYTLRYATDATDGGFRVTFTARVPKGFDGVVVGLMNAAVADAAEDEAYFYDYYTGPEDFALFRMK